MLWSALKIILFLVLIGTLSLVAATIMDAGGPVRVEMAGYLISIQPIMLIIGIIIVVPLTWFAIWFFGLLKAVFSFLIGDETALSRYFRQRTERQGFEALTEGMLALASGQSSLALSKARQAERCLDRPELTGLLIAQAADASGDRERAARAYRTLALDKRTRLAGLTGMLRHTLSDGDTDTALKIAEKMFALNSANVDLQDNLIKLQSAKGDWEGARATLAVKRKSKLLPKDVVVRRNAVLLLAEGRAKLDDGDVAAGEEAILAANRASPGLVPAAVLAAQLKSRAGDVRAATRIIQRAWNSTPHPDLAAVFADLEPDETAAQRLARFRKLIGSNRDDESRMVLAELCIADGDFAVAREELGDVAQTREDVRSLVIMAAIERGEGSREDVVRGWLTKAVAASRGARWVCDACGRSDTEWTPVCAGCAGLDTLEWRQVAASGSVHAASVGMMPRLFSAAD